MSNARRVAPGRAERAEHVCVVWRDPHPATSNAMISIAYLHHRGLLDALADEDGNLTMNRFTLSEMMWLPPSVILSDDPEEMVGPAREFYEALPKTSHVSRNLKIECESDLFTSTTRDVMESTPLRKILGKSLTRLAR